MYTFKYEPQSTSLQITFSKEIRISGIYIQKPTAGSADIGIETQHPSQDGAFSKLALPGMTGEDLFIDCLHDEVYLAGTIFTLSCTEESDILMIYGDVSDPAISQGEIDTIISELQSIKTNTAAMVSGIGSRASESTLNAILTKLNNNLIKCDTDHVSIDGIVPISIPAPLVAGDAVNVNVKTDDIPRVSPLQVSEIKDLLDTHLPLFTKDATLVNGINTIGTKIDATTSAVHQVTSAINALSMEVTFPTQMIVSQSSILRSINWTGNPALEIDRIRVKLMNNDYALRSLQTDTINGLVDIETLVEDRLLKCQTDDVVNAINTKIEKCNTDNTQIANHADFLPFEGPYNSVNNYPRRAAVDDRGFQYVILENPGDINLPQSQVATHSQQLTPGQIITLPITLSKFRILHAVATTSNRKCTVKIMHRPGGATLETPLRTLVMDGVWNIDDYEYAPLAVKIFHDYFGFRIENTSSGTIEVFMEIEYEEM